jgi:hypothetical protein
MNQKMIHDKHYSFEYIRSLKSKLLQNQKIIHQILLWL